jgi:hypothetical protein
MFKFPGAASADRDLSLLVEEDCSWVDRHLSTVSFMMTAPAPTKVSGATVMASRNVELTPRKLLCPIFVNPEITTCDVKKQWSSITASCPT